MVAHAILCGLVIKLSRFVATFVISMVQATTALALDQATTQPLAAKFPKDSFTLHTSIGYARGLDKDEADIGVLELGGNYYIWNNFSIGTEIAGYGISQLGEDAVALGIAGTFRHHFWQHDVWTIFVDGAFGPSYSSRDTPQGGTHFNFISRIGLGATYQLEENLHLLFGARYWHMSNARIEGVDRNPNFNCVQAYIGLMWQF